MNEKIFGVLIGVVLTVVALSIAGYTLAHTESGSSETDMPMGFGPMGGMMGMHRMMWGNDYEHVEEMHEECEEMMEHVVEETEDPEQREFYEDMLEHMESCPMMKRFHSE